MNGLDMGSIQDAIQKKAIEMAANKISAMCDAMNTYRASEF